MTEDTKPENDAKHGDDGQHSDHDEHHGGTGKYWMVFLALCFLTLGSFLTYFPIWNDNIPRQVSWTFMMAISCTKALLVITFFMHLLWEANWKYVLTIPAGLMSLFLIGMLIPDIGYRYENYSHERLIHSPQPVVHAEHDHEDGEHPHGEDGGSH